jgi:hypothetical protein
MIGQQTAATNDIQGAVTSASLNCLHPKSTTFKDKTFCADCGASNHPVPDYNSSNA